MYKDDEIGKDYVPGQQDDDDFEKLKIKECFNQFKIITFQGFDFRY